MSAATQAPPASDALTMSGAEVVLRALKDNGVEVIFGYPGGAVLPIYDAIFQQNAIRHILVRHEQGAGHAAEGFAAATGRVGVCIATSGPGATNLVTPIADAAMDSAACIGCGACVAACPNGAANLFTGAKISHLNVLPQGQSERYKRAEAMVHAMDDQFGSCTNHGECSAACPKEISLDVIAMMNTDFRKSKSKNRKSLSRS